MLKNGFPNSFLGTLTVLLHFFRLQEYLSCFSVSDPQTFLYDKRRKLVLNSVEESQEEVDQILTGIKDIRHRAWDEWKKTEAALSGLIYSLTSLSLIYF